MRRQSKFHKMTPFWIAVDDKSSKYDTLNSRHKYIHNIIVTLTRPLWENHILLVIVQYVFPLRIMWDLWTWNQPCWTSRANVETNALRVKNEHMTIKWNWIRKSCQNKLCEKWHEKNSTCTTINHMKNDEWLNQNVKNNTK